MGRAERAAGTAQHGDQGIDPSSFIYALPQKNTRRQRSCVYSSVTERFAVTSPLPDFRRRRLSTCFPRRPQRSRLFHDSKNFSPELLWCLFGHAVKDEPQIDSTTFRDVLKLKLVAQVKLTQALSPVNSFCQPSTAPNR